MHFDRLGFGQAGSAILPFVTGFLGGKFGIASLQPLSVGNPTHNRTLAYFSFEIELWLP